MMTATALSYNLTFRGSVMCTTTSYRKALEASKKHGWKIERVYTEFDPFDTPKKQDAFKAHAKKVHEKLHGQRGD